MVQLCGEAEATVVLGEGLFGVPGGRGLASWLDEGPVLKGLFLPVCGDYRVVENSLLGFGLLGDFVEGGAVLLFLEFTTHCVRVFVASYFVDVGLF